MDKYNKVVFDCNFIFNKFYFARRKWQQETFTHKWINKDTIYLNKFNIFIDSALNILVNINELLKNNFKEGVEATFVFDLKQRKSYDSKIYDAKFNEYVKHYQYDKNTMFEFISLIKYIKKDEREYVKYLYDYYYEMYPEYLKDDINEYKYVSISKKYLGRAKIMFMERMINYQGRLLSDEVRLCFMFVLNCLQGNVVFDNFMNIETNLDTIYVTNKVLHDKGVMRFNLKKMVRSRQLLYIGDGGSGEDLEMKEKIKKLTLRRCFNLLNSKYRDHILDINPDCGIELFDMNIKKLFIKNKIDIFVNSESVDDFTDISDIHFEEFSEVINDIFNKYNGKFMQLKVE